MIFEHFNVASYIFISLFFLAMIFELIFAFLEKEKYRLIAKPFCLSFLVLFLFSLFIDQYIVYIAAFFGLIGDIFLMCKKDKCFLIGAFSFLLGHVLYILYSLIFILNWNIKPYQIIIISALFVVEFIVLLFVTNKFKISRFEKVGGALYLTTLTSLIPLFIFASLERPNYMYLALVGSVLFLISDSILSFSRYIKPFKRHDFYIMLTYLLAQLFIGLGLCLTYVNIWLFILKIFNEFLKSFRAVRIFIFDVFTCCTKTCFGFEWIKYWIVAKSVFAFWFI